MMRRVRAVVGILFVFAFLMPMPAKAAGRPAVKSLGDLELDFYFLRTGLNRKEVISLLGEPHGITVSKTLKVKYDKLSWKGADGQTYTASFVFDRLWRWKRCSASAKNC